MLSSSSADSPNVPLSKNVSPVLDEGTVINILQCGLKLQKYVARLRDAHRQAKCPVIKVVSLPVRIKWNKAKRKLECPNT
jgi:hypothetical protein